MTTGIKQWWKACRRPGEPLKAFARRHLCSCPSRCTHTARVWVTNKRMTLGAADRTFTNVVVFVDIWNDGGR